MKKDSLLKQKKLDFEEQLTVYDPTRRDSKNLRAIKTNLDRFDRIRSNHKAEIAKIKAQRKRLKADIKQHRLLIRQAKLAYKLSELKEK